MFRLPKAVRGCVYVEPYTTSDFSCTVGIRTELVPAYVRLLRDNEAEVRIAAAGKVTKFCGIVTPQVAQQHILPCVKVRVCYNFVVTVYIRYCILIFLAPYFSAHGLGNQLAQ